MKYKVFSKDKSGAKHSIEAESIVFELEDGKTIEIDLMIPPKQWSGLTIMTPEITADMDVTSSIFSIRPGASNLINLSVLKPQPDDGI